MYVRCYLHGHWIFLSNIDFHLVPVNEISLLQRSACALVFSSRFDFHCVSFLSNSFPVYIFLTVCALVCCWILTVTDFFRTSLMVHLLDTSITWSACAVRSILTGITVSVSSSSKTCSSVFDVIKSLNQSRRWIWLFWLKKKRNVSPEGKIAVERQRERSRSRLIDRQNPESKECRN